MMDPRLVAMEFLVSRGFVRIGEDAMGLPCFRSPSRALLISIGSCRSLAYVEIGGTLRVVAAARTSVLACRIAGPAADEAGFQPVVLSEIPPDPAPGTPPESLVEVPLPVNVLRMKPIGRRPKSFADVHPEVDRIASGVEVISR